MMANTFLIFALFLSFFAGSLVSGQRTLTSGTHKFARTRAKCPCANPDWCDPIKDTNRKEVFSFSVKNISSHWENYDWSKVTTVAMSGFHNDAFMCMAHALGRRVSYIANINIDFRDPNQRQAWILNQTDYIREHFFDGINFDYESAISEDDDTTRRAYTSLVAESNTVFKKVFPYFQVSVDVAWRQNVDSRFYDYVGLASNSDFLFVMAYDEQSQIHGECVSMPNSGLDRALEGLGDYTAAGISKDKLVLGLPWYGYVYPCIKLEGDKCLLKHVPFRGVNCSDAAGSQSDFSNLEPLASKYYVKWNQTSMTPFFTYMDDKTSTFKQVQFDNPKSLTIKYQMAVKMGLRGVGMWNLDCLNYDDSTAGQHNRQEMFAALPSY